MSDVETVRATVLEILGGIAPEADLSSLRPDANFRRELDLDSVDFQTFVIRLCQKLGVEIRDRDAGRLVTMEACLRQLARR